jgi:hypothetical protein
MTDPLVRRLAVEAIRLFAASQAVGMVFVHAAWLLLAIALWRHHAEGSMVDALGTRLLRSYAWLGGIGPDGRGDETGMMLVWGKISVVVYALDALLRAVRRGRRPIAMWRVAIGSALVVFAGFLFAFWPKGLDADAWLLATMFAVFGLGATFWAVGAHRLGELLAERMLATAPGPAAAEQRDPG